MAHERLLPLLPHRVPHPLRGVDRDHVGLHADRRDDVGTQPPGGLRARLSHGPDRRKPRGESISHAKNVGLLGQNLVESSSK